MSKANDSAVGFGADPQDLDYVASNSSPGRRADAAIFAIDAAMRSNGGALRSKVADEIRPVIIAQFDLRGGTYTLMSKDGAETVQPVDAVFERVKSISHAPLGIYTILAPYLKDPSAPGWQQKLAEFQVLVRAAAGGLANVKLPSNARAWSETILCEADNFVADALKNKTFTITEFRAFAQKVFPAIAGNLQVAADTQVEGTARLLLRWKREMGEAAWRDLYAICMVTWTIEFDNQQYLILNKFMDQRRIQERLYVVAVGSVQENTIPVALGNLAMIVQDKVAGHMVFGDKPEQARRLNQVLATQYDLLSEFVKVALQNWRN
jgi:hypothetical protein